VAAAMASLRSGLTGQGTGGGSSGGPSTRVITETFSAIVPLYSMSADFVVTQDKCVPKGLPRRVGGAVWGVGATTPGEHSAAAVYQAGCGASFAKGSLLLPHYRWVSCAYPTAPPHQCIY
jgi:hypothetical protein